MQTPGMVWSAYWVWAAYWVDQSMSKCWSCPTADLECYWPKPKRLIAAGGASRTESVKWICFSTGLVFESLFTLNTKYSLNTPSAHYTVLNTTVTVGQVRRLLERLDQAKAQEWSHHSKAPKFMCYPAAWHPAATLQLESFTEKGTSARHPVLCRYQRKRFLLYKSLSRCHMSCRCWRDWFLAGLAYMILNLFSLLIILLWGWMMLLFTYYRILILTWIVRRWVRRSSEWISPLLMFPGLLYI